MCLRLRGYEAGLPTAERRFTCLCTSRGLKTPPGVSSVMVSKRLKALGIGLETSRNLETVVACLISSLVCCFNYMCAVCVVGSDY